MPRCRARHGIRAGVEESLSLPFSIAGREVFTSASIGIAFGPAHYNNPDEIMRDADTAMYHAKSRGKARHEVFDDAMHARVRDRLSLENDLRRAIASNEFEVDYQPIVSLASGMCVGFESLVRWTRNGEPVSPATFVPIAEELGLIEPLGTWVIQQACQTFADWQRRYPGRRPRLHHRQRLEPAAGAAELPARGPADACGRPASGRPTCGSRSPRPRCSTVPARPPACCANCATSA